MYATGFLVIATYFFSDINKRKIWKVIFHIKLSFYLGYICYSGCSHLVIRFGFLQIELKFSNVFVISHCAYNKVLFDFLTIIPIVLEIWKYGKVYAVLMDNRALLGSNKKA